MKIIGIDCGLKGYISVLDEGKYIGSFAMPTYYRAKRTHIEVPKLRDIILAIAPDAAVIERQFAMPKQGLSSTFTTAMNYGLIVGMLSGLGIQYQVADASKWQRYIFGGKVENTKQSSIAAIVLWDNSIDLRKSDRARVASADKADSINIARYGAEVLYAKE